MSPPCLARCFDVDSATALTVSVGVISTGLSGLGALIMWMLHKSKFVAEVHKLEAETDGLTTDRLIKELDRLSESNDALGKMVQEQRTEIDELRRQAAGYAARESELGQENKSLRDDLRQLQARLAKLEGR